MKYRSSDYGKNMFAEAILRNSIPRIQNLRTGVSSTAVPSAVLLLCGWYLMVPALKAASVVINQPLSKWTYLNSFDTAKECREAAVEHQQQAERDTPEDKPRQIQAESWECIATDDPRLAH